MVVEGQKPQPLAVHCLPCWKARGSLCIICDTKASQNERAFGHRCKRCVADGRDHAFAPAIARDAQDWIDAEASRPEQHWDGSEPALQLLILPQPSATPPAAYAAQPTALAAKHCRLCLKELEPTGADVSMPEEPVPVWPDQPDLPDSCVPAPGVSESAPGNTKASALAEHLREEHDGLSPEQYRTMVLEDALHNWPQPISPQILRARLAGFKAELTDSNFRLEPCACCARQKKPAKLQYVCFPLPDAAVCPPWLLFSAAQWREHGAEWHRQLDSLFNVKEYMHRAFSADLKLEIALADVENTRSGADTRFATEGAAQVWLDRVTKWAANLRAALVADSLAAPGLPGEHWLLYAPEGGRARVLPDGSLSCFLCKKCVAPLQQCKGGSARAPDVRMPKFARANVLWGGPELPELKVLTFAERKVIQLARAYICVKRVMVTGQRPAAAQEAPKYHERNVVAFPQNPSAVQRIVGLMPDALSGVLAVQFVGGSRSDVRREPSLMVSVHRLRAAFGCLLQNCWPWMEATKYDLEDVPEGVGTRVEELLAAYADSTGSHDGGVPSELVQGATSIPLEQAPLQQRGPADAVAGDHDADEAVAAPDDSAAVLQGGLDEVGPLALREALLYKYKVHSQVSTALVEAEAAGNEDEAARLRFEDLKAVQSAVIALQRLHHEDIKRELERFHRELQTVTPKVYIVQRNEMLSSFAPEFWSHCFVDLFPRGDCQERVPGGRPTPLLDFMWAKCLLTRADFTGWRMNLEFVASLYNILLRRSQMRAVHYVVVKQPSLTASDQAALSSIAAKDFVAEALTSGDCDSLKKLLHRKGLSDKLRGVVHAMELAFRHVRGSDSEKLAMRKRFVAMRVWNGFSSLFFTINPHDIRSPITVALTDHKHFLERCHVERFSLELGDDAKEKYFERLLGVHPRMLHEIAVQDPSAATRCFHATVRLTVRTLFHCTEPGTPFPDGVPSETEPGIFGYIAGYLGVVEPQMRKALHLHMLIQLHGFSHPRDLFADGHFVERFRNMWYFVASICFRSTEAFAAYTAEPAASDALRHEALLPITPKQRGMLGKKRADDSVCAQLRARGLAEVPRLSAPPGKPVFYMPSMYGDSSTDSSTWAASSTKELLAATRKSGNHVCRPDVCHKGKIGRYGFCRMRFWHWVQDVSKQGEATAVRAHGLQLQQRWDGMGRLPVYAVPPFRGAPMLEISHPFHIKMTPGIFLGPRCNHDLGVLLRFPAAANTGTERSLQTAVSVSSKSEAPVPLWPGIDDPSKIHTPPQAASMDVPPPTGEAPPDDEQDLVDRLLDDLANSEFYCSVYASKEQPHMEGLLVTLAHGIRTLDDEIAAGLADGQAMDQQEKARRVLNRLLSSTNRRMHKGFPEMLSYLLGKPSWYCSHKFATLYINTVFEECILQVLGAVQGVPLAAAHTNSMHTGLDLRNTAVAGRLAKPKSPSGLDYRFRSAQLDAFPWYFLVASCETTPRKPLTHPELKWFEQYRDAGGHVVRHPAYTSGPVATSKTYSGVPLRLHTGAEILHQYPHFLYLRTCEAWRVPMLLGHMPRKPDASSTPEERGRYGLFLMLLFRPWRGAHTVDFLTAALSGGPSCSTSAEAWGRVFIAYEAWRRQLDEAAAPFCSRHRQTPSPRPEFGTVPWWSCMCWLRLRHLELVLSSHQRFSDEQPPDIALLAANTGGTDPCAVDPSAGPGEFEVEEQEADGTWRCAGDVLNSCNVHELPEETEPKRAPGKFAASATRACATMPGMSTLGDYVTIPLQGGGMSAEMRYAQGFEAALHAAAPVTQVAGPRFSRPPAHLSSAVPAEIGATAERQREYFVAIDAFQV